MSIVTVRTQRPYEVKIGEGLLDNAGQELLAVLGRCCTVAVLTDDTVDGLYGSRVQQALESSGFRVCRFAMPHGEIHKNLTCWGEMLSFLAENQLTRTDCVVGLGGGVPGDMAGFAAASYLRGVAFVQMPTTLLAMVDSSVGGKTGLDLPAGKNLAGTFYQPRLVLCDTDTLDTLPPDTLLDGAAECIKYGVLGDAELFDRFADGSWAGERAEIIRSCVAAKARLVEEDEHDTGSRQLLNLGHTLGHAIEKCSGYAISHGHAVAIGMVYAARLSYGLGLCTKETTRRLTEVVGDCGLPTDASYGPEELLKVVLSDKKRMGDTQTFVLPTAIGHCQLTPVPVARLPELIALALTHPD